MKVVTTVCDEPGMRVLESCFGRENVTCASGAEESFLQDAEVLIFLEWNPARAAIKRMKKLKILQALSAGIDHIPKDEIPPGVVLSSNVGSNAWAVAEHALTLILAALKKLSYRDRMMRTGEFPQLLPSRLLRGKSVGIVGFGHIGQSLARMLAPFNVEIYAINRTGMYSGDIRLKFIGKLRGLDYLLAHSDIVILSIPLTDETRGLINRERLEKMKRDAILINVARGKIIEQGDLYEFLKENKNFTAALDTWWHYGEKFKQDYQFEKLDNVILSPHCAGVYETWLEDAMQAACEKIKSKKI